MTIKNILTLLLGATMLAGCSSGESQRPQPKPKAYLRIELPKHEYFLLDTLRIHGGDTAIYDGDTMVFTSDYVKTFPFSFEANRCIEWTEKDAPKGTRWIDLKYPQWDGVIVLTYNHLRSPSDLRGQTDTSLHLLEQHYQFSSGIDERAFEDRDRRVFATVWHIKGRNVASTYQFYATDSLHHFLRGALFINRPPNNDSLAPVLEYMQRDIDHLIETLCWR